MKLTTRCGEAAVHGLNEALLVKAAEAKLLRTNKVRADTTVMEAEVAYPTDSGLLAKAIGAMARSVERIKAAGGATRTRARDRRRSARRRARSIAAKLRLRGEQQHDQAQAAVRRITGELARMAEATIREASAVVRNARRALRAATGPRKGRLRQAINHLDTIDGTRRTGCGPNPQPAGWGDARVGHPAGQPARCRCPPDPQGTAGQARRVRLQGPDRRQRRRRHPRPQRRGRKPARRTTIGPGNRTDHHRTGHPPRAVTADRGYGDAAVEHDLHDLGVRSVAIPRTSKPSAARREFEYRRAFRDKIKWRTGSEGRINHLKRSYGWNRTELTGIDGARTWCGHGVFAHNLVKISNLAA